MLKGLHHLNFVVRDLDAAVAAWERVLGLPPALREDLPARGARTARFRIGESWLVLLQPTDPGGAPGRHLAQHGEGFFLLSFAVDDLEAATQRVQAQGGRAIGSPRAGLGGWQVQDIGAPALGAGAAIVQLCKSR